MKISDLLEQPTPVAPGTNTGGVPTTQQAPKTPAQPGQPGAPMDPMQANKQKQDQKKALAIQLKQAQDAVKSAQENVKAIQAQMAAIR